jgi:hypothetical protein
MYKSLDLLLQATAVVAALSLTGCSDDKTGASAPGNQAGCPAKDAGCPAKEAGCPAMQAGCPAAGPSHPGTADLPATGSDADVKAWIAGGEYKKGNWKCEPAPHAARSPSPHGTTQICSNATLSAHGTGEFPVGSAAVKELYKGNNVIGHAMYRKLSAGAGESWYWYEDMNGSVVANNTGDSGTAKSVCVGCHSATGSDTMHSGHDFVYTQVK